MITLLLFSCSSQEKKIIKENISQIYETASGYNAEISVVSKSFNYSFKVQRLKPDYYSIEIVEPKNLQGLSIQTKGVQSNVNYKGLSVSIDLIPLNIKAGIGLINNILSSLDTVLMNLNAKKVDDLFEFSGKLDENTNVTIKLKVKDMLPLGLTINNNQETYEISIKNFELIT